MARVPGTNATESFAAPSCSTCGEKCIRNDDGEWFCLKCADEWLERYVSKKLGGRSMGGVVLPAGVLDARRKTPSFRDAQPNRAARRAARRRK